MKISKQWKKKPRDIIILQKGTKNHDQMLHCSWDIAHGRCNCHCPFWGIFSPFTPLIAPKKMKLQKNAKNTWRYHHLTQVYQKSWSYAILLLRQVSRWDQHNCTRAGRHKGRSICQRDDRPGNTINVTENRAGKIFFFPKDSKEACP